MLSSIDRNAMADPSPWRFAFQMICRRRNEKNNQFQLKRCALVASLS